MTEIAPLRVRFDAADADGAHLRAIASLPALFRQVDGDADVYLVEHRDRAPDARGLVLTSPSRLADAPAGAVPALPALKFAPRLVRGVDLESGADQFLIATLNVALKDWDRIAAADAIAEMLACLRVLGMPAVDLRVISDNNTHMMLSGQASSGAPFKLSVNASASGVDTCTISAASLETRLEADLQSGAAARAARITRYDINGSASRFPTHQHGYRLVWQELHARLCKPEAAREDFLQSQDIHLLRTLPAFK